MRPEYFSIAIDLGGALVAGSLIGLERTYRGRPAGFRTHALVCLASATLMLMTTFQQIWLSPDSPLTGQLEPTRTAQGIMTGIGFLGAGVIFKDGFTVRGLTTAASIWMTAVLGMMFGIGFYSVAIVGTLATLGTLSVFRAIETRMPSEFYAQHYLRFARDRTLPEPEVHRLLAEHGFTVMQTSYRLTEERNEFEYRMIIRTIERGNLPRLAESLRAMPNVVEFRILPSGE